MSWSSAEIETLRRLAGKDKFFYTEIAKELNKNPASVRWKARKLGLPLTQVSLKHRLGQWNVKHKNFREPVFRYFLNHTWDETREKFKLTDRELKSIFTVGYRDPKMKHLRKETRRRDSWSSRELRFLITHAGIMPRDWIGKKLKRGTAICIKERMEKLGVSSRTINGITLSQFKMAFGKRPEFVLKTKAGPGRGGTPTYFQIVPWVWLDQEMKAKRLKAPKVFRQLACTMALFQNWIHGGSAMKNLSKIARKRIESA